MLVAVAVACHPSLLTAPEAKRLAIDGSCAAGTFHRFVLVAENGEFGDRGKASIVFRVFARNRDPGTSGDLAGWFRIDPRTAELSDPILDDKPIDIPQVRGEQKMLRALHCQGT